jgi:cytochrome b
MTRILVWDLPTRLFHWMLAAGFLAAFGIAQFVSDDSPLFTVHMLLGLVLGLMVLLRIIWGFTGSKYARFRSFLFSPGDVLGYVKDAFTGKGKRYIGHNPGSGYAIFAMFVLLLGIVATGLLMPSGNELFEEIHPFFAYAMIGVVAAHILGVIWHTIRHQENIALSMVSGTKEGEPNEGIPSARPLAGIVFLVLTGFWAGGLFRDYDPNTRQTTLPIFGQTVPLGESENEGEEHEGRAYDRQEDDDD